MFAPFINSPVPAEIQRIAHKERSDIAYFDWSSADRIGTGEWLAFDVPVTACIEGGWYAGTLEIREASRGFDFNVGDWEEQI